MRVILMLFSALFFHSNVVVAQESVHEFTVSSISGDPVELSSYEGKVLLIVNTASKCGFTKQYKDLVALQKAYADQGVVVIGFPANNFGRQEPGSNQEIHQFCRDTYGVDFPMMEKVSVKGEDQHPLFRYLTQTDNPDFKGNVRWNFEKFVVGKDGKLLRRFRSMTNPNGDKMRKALDEALAQVVE